MELMSEIRGVRGVVPDHVHTQEEITAAFEDVVLSDEPPDSPRRHLLQQVHASAGVQTRHLALPLDAYVDLDGFGAANNIWIDVGLDLGARAVAGALADAELEPTDVDLLVTTSVTGLAAPSLDARLAGPLGLRDDVKRVPMFGLGCVAGVAGIARLADYLRGHPDGVAVLLSVELCSLTVQRNDTSTANLIGSGLFGDGAAAVVMVGAQRAERLPWATSGARGFPRVVASRSRLYPNSERIMGWDISGSGFKLVLDVTVADVVGTYLRGDVKAFLTEHDLAIEDVDTWIAHPGGPKVIDTVVRELSLPPSALDITRRSLSEIGNLSSSSVLHVLEHTMRERPAGGNGTAVLLAMGPGFCSELVLLEW